MTTILFWELSAVSLSKSLSSFIFVRLSAQISSANSTTKRAAGSLMIKSSIVFENKGIDRPSEIIVLSISSTAIGSNLTIC